MRSRKTSARETRRYRNIESTKPSCA
jgi:hypothetical protein